MSEAQNVSGSRRWRWSSRWRAGRLACALVLAVMSVAGWTPRAALAEETVPAGGEVAGRQAARTAVDDLAARWFELQLDLDPVASTRMRLPGRDHLLPPPPTTADVDALRREIEGLQAKLDAIRWPGSAPELQLEVDALRWELASRLDVLRFPGHLLAVDRYGDGAPFSLVQLISPRGAQPLETVADLDAWAERLEAFPPWVDGALVNLREGMEHGVVLSRMVAESTLRRLENILASPQRPLERPLTLLRQRGFDAAEAKRLERRLRAATGNAEREYRRLRDFVRDVYLPKARPEISWQTLPDGDAWYRALVRRSTTTDQTPEELLGLGLREAKRILAEMEQLAQQLGHGSVAALYGAVEADSLREVKPAEVLAEFARVEKRVRIRLPRLFEKVPESPFVVQQVTAAEAVWGPGDVYRSPSIDGRVPGVFFALIGRRYAMSNIEPLFLHEGLPGHHFQMARALESEVPLYRRASPWTAFVEGWGLYAESLGADLGLYGDPQQRAGRLAMELLRAARLVLDTGIHAGGWTAEQAVAQSRSQLLGSGENEVSRYAGMPAQALGYKVGEQRILEIRSKAANGLGDAFDLRSFHGALLGAGPLPLDLLEREVLRRLGVKAPAAPPGE